MYMYQCLVPHTGSTAYLYSAAWSAVVATSRCASGCLLGGVLAAVAAGLRGRGFLMPSNRPDSRKTATRKPGSLVLCMGAPLLQLQCSRAAGHFSSTVMRTVLSAFASEKQQHTTA
jgi:hypothetical protein